ncbi:MAG: MopE-related protein, partial [Myxococcota bacterium]|nr:MopE-related protein [Myxococcota bacterium]
SELWERRQRSAAVERQRYEQSVDGEGGAAEEVRSRRSYRLYEHYKAEAEEKCNGLDDDCDGVTDEGNPEGGTACGTPNNTQGGPPNLVLPCTIGQMSCLNGQLQCVGGVDPGPEVCDGIDNDCDGVADDNPQGDQWETNQSCQTLTDLGFVVENQGTSTFQANLFPGSDVDWYRVTAKESANFCFGGEEGPYTFSVTLKPPSTANGASENLDYDLCVYPMDSTNCANLPPYGLCDSGSPNNLGIWKGPGQAETFTSDSWMGECFDNDDRTFIIQVVTYDAENDFSCDPYTLEIQHSGN